ncbi:GDSL-type esterase/lipase family protein [Fibrobacter sp. UWEL]|uniref:GDSL-type esterase/lipase family protein n=1 Tax=Fibrobacter sp. UWEL TaxID=1896209 RepID=UPI0009184948|nr:GDSL-type esterase/lipase family protein [Fibrobacter sp. UWEL]SHK32964.1 Por secretion system C-terminal sorting domain-containing protein [Fibrobacter sp. UWEL]
MGFKILATAAMISALFAVNASAQTRIACVGNSITYGYGLNGATTYPQHLQYVLGGTYQVENYGNSGKMFHKASQESYWTQPEFKKAYAFEPNIVIIELGTNDSKYFFSGSEGNYNYYFYEYKQDSQGKNYTRESLIAEMKKDYEALIDTFLHNNHTPEIYVTLQPYANNLGWFITDSAIVNVINPMIKEVAEKKRVNVIDLHSLLNKREWLQADSVHPNEEGAKAMAEIIGESIMNGPIMTGPLESSSSVITESSSSNTALASSSSDGKDGLTTVLRTNSQITVQGKSIQLNHISGTVEVFDLNGNLVKRSVSNGFLELQMKLPGVYIVKTNLTTQKVILK